LDSTGREKKWRLRDCEGGNRGFYPSDHARAVTADNPNDYFVAASQLLDRTQIVIEGSDRSGPQFAVDLGYNVISLEAGVTSYAARFDLDDKHAMGTRQSDLPGSIGIQRLDRQSQRRL